MYDDTYVHYLSKVGMIAGGGPLGGGGKPGGGTVMGNPMREKVRLNTLKPIKQSKSKVRSNITELTGRRDEWGCSTDIGWWREERRWWYVWRNRSRRKECGHLCCSPLSI